MAEAGNAVAEAQASKTADPGRQAGGRGRQVKPGIHGLLWVQVTVQAAVTQTAGRKRQVPRQAGPRKSIVTHSRQNGGRQSGIYRRQADPGRQNGRETQAERTERNSIYAPAAATAAV